MLKETYVQLIKQYTDNEDLIADYWDEVEIHYTKSNRHYHTLKHLENLLNQLLMVKSEIKNWETILFALFYHDLVYNALKSDNEEQSAEFAEQKMKQIGVPGHVIEGCKKQILATKSHLEDSDGDTNLFTDADLSILGQGWETYSRYTANVRKEYSVYPDLVYNPGRRKVLNHFLGMERIFKTEYFHSKFEKQAKINLKKELERL
ncbi:MAG: hypothetical protein JWQ25_157 [Daejeonella sp.]|nr:hypothetical protein [Daejeonella sp.]